MKEIRYTYDTRGVYSTAQDTAFGDEDRLMLVVEPHEFDLSVGGDSLRRTACAGYRITVAHNGEAVFCAADGAPIATTPATDSTYHSVRLNWTPDRVCVEFGHTATVDHYPNCDGEHDRWSTRWVAEHVATLE